MRLLSLICLARCAAALPDIGVTYAATGRLNVLMATESVRQLSTRYAHVHTLSADDHGDLQPPPVYIDHACRKPREYAERSGNASFFLGR